MSQHKIEKDGKEYINIGNGLWIALEDLPSREEVNADKYRYSNPKIYIFEIIMNIILPLLGTILLFFMLKTICNIPINKCIIICLICLLVYLILRLKDIAIFIVHLYQKFAPIEVRSRCGYYPTCSDYMILSIRKYGLIIGIIKGYKRIKRCDGSHKEEWP